jgi:hypothetical protein
VDACPAFHASVFDNSMSLKARTYKDIKLNKYLGIVIMIVFLSTTIVSLEFTYGQSGNLTMNQTNRIAQNQTEAYGDVLMDIIRNANITIPSDLHPTTKQLEKIAHEIVEGGHPNKILDELKQNKS